MVETPILSLSSQVVPLARVVTVLEISALMRAATGLLSVASLSLVQAARLRASAANANNLVSIISFLIYYFSFLRVFLLSFRHALQVGIHIAAVNLLPTCDAGFHSGFRRGLGYGAAEGERYGLVSVEVREGCRQVALKFRRLRVAV